MANLNSLHTPRFKGNWNDNVSWEFYLSDELPPQNLCTAVFCLAILDGSPESIVMTRNKRGWEMLGGHIDPGESVEDALVREAIEEGGFYPTLYRPFGYRKVMARVLVANDHHGGSYPPESFIPHFIATTTEPIVAPTGEEILESRVFGVGDLPAIEASQAAIIQAGLTAFRGTGLKI